MVGLSIGGAVLSLAPVPAQAGLVLTVNSTGDGSDSSAGDGVCDNGAGACTLRAAIQDANVVPGADTIQSAIPGPTPHTITPSSGLPWITTPAVIDATTKPGTRGRVHKATGVRWFAGHRVRRFESKGAPGAG